MALFPFGRKIEFAKEYSLSEIPVFSTLNPTEQRLIEKKARLVEFKRGDIVYKEATPSDAFYVVITGRFRLFTRSYSNPQGETLLFFYRGDHFGETSLLSEKLHSGTVEAERDGILLKLEKEDFLKLLHDIPSISLYLSRSLGHRLSRTEDASRRREVKIASLYSKSKAPEVFQLWLDMAARLRKETGKKVILVTFGQGVEPLVKQAFQRVPPSFNLELMDPSREQDLSRCVISHSEAFDYLHVEIGQESDVEVKKIGALVTFLTYRYDYLFLNIAPQINQVSFKALKQSDRIYVFSQPGSSDLEETSKFLSELQGTFGFSPTDIQVLLPDVRTKDGKSLDYSAHEETLGAPIFAVLPERDTHRERYDNGVRFMVKEMAGTLVGLALGSGAAYGLAHIGVIRILEQEKINIDVIAGCSIGALVGGLWAAGYNADEMEKIAKSIDIKSGFFKLIGFQDLSIAHRGFFKGDQMQRFFEKHLGDKTFQDMQIPLKIVACDLFTSEEFIFDSGRVADAIRISASIPGIFRPVKYHGKYLIDGGVVDPLPVRVLTQMGIKKIIAVNVLPGPRDRAERHRVREESRRQQEKTALEGRKLWDRLLAGSFNKVYDRYAVNIFNVIMSTIQFMEYEIAQSWSAQVDVMIHPYVQEAHWAEFYAPDKFIKAGEEKTREQINEIKKLIQVT